VVRRLEHLLCEEKLRKLDLAWRRDSSGGTQQLLCNTYGKSIKNMEPGSLRRCMKNERQQS